MARKRNPALASALAGGTKVAARGTTGMAGSKPKAGYQFVAKTGLRAGQSYNVKRGASGLAERVFETGDTADTASARQARQSPLAQRGQQGAPAGYNVGTPAPSGTLQKNDVQQRRKVAAPTLASTLNPALGSRALARRLKRPRRFDSRA